MKKQKISIILATMLLVGGNNLLLAKNNSIKLDEISVTTASINDVLIKDTPANIDVITAEDIKKSGATTVKDILKRVAGLSINGGAGDGTISIRGGHFEDVLFLLNGRKLAGAEARRGKHQKNEWVTENLDINSIERIEILRGSASVLYGSEASAGVINIITKKSEQKSVNAGFQVGNYKLSNFYNIDFGSIGNFDAIANINLIKKNPVKKDFQRVDGVYYKSPEGETYNLMLDIGYKFDENNELRLFTTATQVDEFYEQNKVNIVDPTGPLKYEKIIQDENRYTTALTYTGNSENNFYNATLSYDKFAIKDYERREAPFALKSSYYTSIATLDARNTWNINEHNIISFGTTYSTTKITDEQVRKIWSERGFNSIDEYAFFIQDEIYLFDESLYIVPAIRYDHFSTFGEHWTPSIGATYHINEKHRIKVNYGEAFEAPDTSRLYKVDDDFQGNPNLKPKETKNYELRYEGEYEKFSSSLTLFKANYTNLIEQYEIGSVTNYRNIGKAKNEGFELELTYDFNSNFGTFASYVYSDFENLDKNERLEDSPKGVLNIEAYYDNPSLDFSSSFYGQYVMDKYTTKVIETGYYDTPKEVDYVSFGLSLRKTWNKKYTFSFSVDNIFNSANDESEEYLDPINYWATFEMKF